MRRLVKYEYWSYTLGCGCCSDSESHYTVWEDGVIKEYKVPCEWIEDEVELREVLSHLEPFDIHSDCEWF